MAKEHIHLVGIGGTGMASLAGLLHQGGARVTGSDKVLYPPTSTLLEELGLDVRVGFDRANLDPKPDLVVIEACSICGWIHDECQALGFEVLVCNPAQEPWKWQNLKRKTDRDDALKLAGHRRAALVGPPWVNSTRSISPVTGNANTAAWSATAKSWSAAGPRSRTGSGPSTWPGVWRCPAARRPGDGTAWWKSASIVNRGRNAP